MVGWPWSSAGNGHASEEGFVQPDDMDSRNPATLPHVEKDVLAAGRAACYKARDAFFNCVEADSGHTTPTEIASVGLLYPAQCKSARAFYEQHCRSTWVKHFDRQFCAKKRVKRLLDTGDRARGPINLPANRVGLQPGEQYGGLMVNTTCDKAYNVSPFFLIGTTKTHKHHRQVTPV